MTIINLALIKIHFDFIYPSALHVAQCFASLLIENLNLPSLEPEQQVLSLEQEIENTRQEINDFDGIEYFYFALYKDFLYKVYVARMLFFEINDEEKLRKAFILYERLLLLEDQLLRAMAESSDCSCACVLQKKQEEVFDELTEADDNDSMAYGEMFENTFKEGTVRSETHLVNLQRKIECKVSAGEDYHQLIILEFNHIRDEFNNLDYPDYFYFLNHRQALKRLFIRNCCCKRNYALHKDELIKCISLDKLMRYVNDQLSLNKHNSGSFEVDQLLTSYRIIDLIACMVPDQKLIDLLHETITRLGKELLNERIPLYFISEDIKQSYSELFRLALSHFKELIESTTKDSLAVFIINQISDIEYMEEMAELEGYVLHEHFKHFKKYLECQLHHIQDAQSFRQPEVIIIADKKEIIENKPFSFGYKPGPRELKPIMDVLQLKINIFKDFSDVDAFMEVFTCDDLSKVTRTFKLGCQTNQFKSVMDYLEDYSTNFNPASIEKSGLFISKKGKTITANCLTASNTDSMKGKYAIHNIFMGKH